MIVVDGNNYILTNKKREELRNTVDLEANTIAGCAYRIVLYASCDKILSDEIHNQERKCKLRRDHIKNTNNPLSPVVSNLQLREVLLECVKDIITTEGISADMEDVQKVLKKEM